MKIAIVGATGLVGSNIIQLCEKNFNDDVEYTLFASKSSEGKKIVINNSEYFVKELKKSDIILLGVSRTSKTPTSIYLANRGYKTSNIPLVNEHSIPKILRSQPKLKCVVGLTVDPKRLVDVRKNRMIAIKEEYGTDYSNFN